MFLGLCFRNKALSNLDFGQFSVSNCQLELSQFIFPQIIDLKQIIDHIGVVTTIDAGRDKKRFFFDVFLI